MEHFYPYSYNDPIHEHSIHHTYFDMAIPYTISVQGSMRPYYKFVIMPRLVEAIARGLKAFDVISSRTFLALCFTFGVFSLFD